MEPITLHYSDSMARDVVRAQWWRATGFLYFAAWLASAGIYIYLIWSGYRSWFASVLAVGVVLGGIFPASLYLNRWRTARDGLRRLKKPEATLELFEEELRVTSEAGMLRLAWTSIREVWCLRRFWVVSMSRTQTFALPLADIPPAAQEFILAHVRAVGGKIT